MKPRVRNTLLIGGTVAGLALLAYSQRDRFTPVDVGSRAPEFAGTTLNGEPFSIEGSRGHVIVMNVWATWCAPCRKEMPALERLHQLLQQRGLIVVGVSEDTNIGTPGPLGQPGGDVRAFVNELGLTFRIVHDPERTVETRFLVQGLPTTFIIDKQGRIAQKVIGAKAWDDSAHVAQIEKLMSE